METIVIKVAKETNWAGNEYLIYSADNYGKIAEVDYAEKDCELTRVYSYVNPKTNELGNGLSAEYVSFSSIPTAIIGAEVICKGYFVDRGFWAKFDYTQDILKIRKKAFSKK